MKLLIIDDEEEMRSWLGRMLGKEGFELTFAKNGETGIRTFEEGDFDIVMVDMLLGDMDGIDLVRKFKNERPNVEIIMMSGYGTFSDVVNVMKAGAQDFIEKPVDPDLCLAKVRRAAKIRQLNQNFQFLDEQYNNIRELKEYNENIINQLPLGLLSINIQDVVVGCNSYIKNRFCLNKNLTKCPNCNVRVFLEKHFDSSERIFESYEKLKKDNLPFDFVILNNSLETNKVSHFRILGSKFSAGMLLFINDITEDYNLKQKILENEKVANLGKFVLGITHGLGNNMANVIANISGVEEEVENIANKIETCVQIHMGDEAREDLGDRLQRMKDYSTRLRKRVQEMDMNIRSLLGYSRQQPVYRALTDINQLVEEAAIIVQSKEYKGIIFEKNFSRDIPMIKVNPYQIKDVFVDLMLNGVQAMENGGTLSYSTEYVKEKDMIRISISDTGYGIPEENKGKIFNVFFTTKKTGTGLGLPNVKSIVKQHEGEIDLKSELGKGTIFFVDLKVLI